MGGLSVSNDLKFERGGSLIHNLEEVWYSKEYTPSKLQDNLSLPGDRVIRTLVILGFNKLEICKSTR